MTKEEKEAVLHCLRAMIDEELCEECPLYGTTGTDHCEKDCVRLAIEELEQEPCEDAISRQAVLDVIEKAVTKEVARWSIKELPSVNPQKPICPSAGVDCEDCPAYEKKSEWQHDHEILKAYSDGANEVLDKIKAEIANHLQIMDICDVEKVNGVIVQSELTNRKVVLYDSVLQIIDKYIEEDKA